MQIYNIFIFLQGIGIYKIQLYIVNIIITIMKKHNLLAFILLGLAIVSCGDNEKEKNNLFSIDTSVLKQQYKPNENLQIVLKNEKNKTIDSIVYYLNQQKIASVVGNKNLDYSIENQKFGYQEIKALVYYNGSDNVETSARIEIVSNIKPKLVEYEIVNTYPHDIKAYTQGLEFYRDTLYEGTGSGAGNSTGIKEISSLRKVNYKTGEVYKRVNLDQKHFGEGITILNNKVYQLTYRSNVGFVYNADTFEKEKEFPYFKNMEGWGLTNDGKHLYMSDGTEKIWLLDPETLKEVDYINVYTANSKIKGVNELEWINGKIFGNIYFRDAIAIIDPKSGAVEGVINLSELKSKVTQHPDIDVLNGIAYNPKTKTIFVTGKNWDKMFEIKIKE